MHPRTVLGAAIVVLTLVGCDASVEPQPPQGVHLVALPDTLNAIGDSTRLTVTYVTKSGNRPVTDAVTWRSLTPDVLDVTANGYAVARSVGKGRVEIATAAFKDTAAVVVRQILAGLTTTWRAETLFVNDTISVVAGGLDSNGFAMPLPQSPAVESITGHAVTGSAGMMVTAAIPGDAHLTIRVGAFTTVVSLTVESPFVGIAAGNGFSCGLVERGAVYCWGLFGPASQTRPTMVSGLPAVSAIDAGTNNVCALATAGDVYCWGSSSGPYQGVMHLPLPGPMVAVSAGYEFGCALAVDGASYCWGWNQDGEVGVEPTGPGAMQPSPVRTSAPTLSSISAGNMVACGVANGAIVCWGSGFGTTPQTVPSTVQFKSVSVGAGICGITMQDQALCLTGPVTDLTGLGAVQQLSTGNGWACAVLTDASARCWGQNYYGQLGAGTRSDAPFNGPSMIVGGIAFRSISAGTGPTLPFQHSCGVAMDGRAYCWGENSVGQLGNPASQPFDNYRLMLVPVRVARYRSGLQ